MPHDEPMRGGRARREIHDVRNLPRFLECFHNPHSFGGDCFLRLIGGRANMMRAINIRFFTNGVREFSDAGSRLNREHIEACANSFRMNGFDERRLIDYLAARSVDEVRAIFHRFEEV